MKIALLYLLIFSFAASAQPRYDKPGSDKRVARLTADLLSLRSIAPDANTPTQRQMMAQFATDINGLYPKGFVTRSLAAALTSALAGRDLSADSLAVLMSGVLAGFDVASTCCDYSCDLLKSPQYRASAERTYAALITIGISVPDAQSLVKLLYHAANGVANPMVRPIPLARGTPR